MLILKRERERKKERDKERVRERKRERERERERKGREEKASIDRNVISTSPSRLYLYFVLSPLNIEMIYLYPSGAINKLIEQKVNLKMK